MREDIRCGACHNPVPQIGSGHRRRASYDDAYKQRVYRQEEQRREARLQRWRGYKPRIQEILERAMQHHGKRAMHLIVAALEAKRQ